MTKLGTWSKERYPLSWITQRLANRAPEFTLARKWPFSTFQQILNPIGIEIRDINRQLTEERKNIFLTSANIDLLSSLSYLELGIGMTFSSEELPDGTKSFIPPRVFAIIDGTEQEITISEKNDIESLSYTAIPSRLDDGEVEYSYTEVIPRMTLSSLASFTPNPVVLEGHLYISIFNNTTWEYRGRDKIFFPKVFVRGRTRKGVKAEEAIPIQYNGTFKTVNQWKEVKEVFVSYMDETTEIIVECLPFSQESFIDVNNLIVPTSGIEAFRFLRLEDKDGSKTLLSEGFTAEDINTVQLGFSTKETEYEIELLNESGDPIEINSFSLKDTYKYIFAIDDNNLYIYNPELPYPDVKKLTTESSDSKMNLESDRWCYARNDTAVIYTDIIQVQSVPFQIRWTLEDPSGNTWYLGKDGSKWPTTVDAWIPNDQWDGGLWKEQRLEVLLDEIGTYVLTVECFYSDSNYSGEYEILTSKILLYVPSIEPEITIELPATFKESKNIMFDSDNQLWLLDKDNNIRKLNVFYDYFLVDYERNTVWFREDYSSVRVVL